MSTVEEIEQAVRTLPPDQLAAFRAWFDQFDAAVWDLQLDQDTAQGKLDALADEAIKDHQQGRSTDL